MKKFCYIITSNIPAGRFEGSAGMASSDILSLRTQRLESLMGVLAWEVLLCYH